MVDYLAMRVMGNPTLLNSYAAIYFLSRKENNENYCPCNQP